MKKYLGLFILVSFKIIFISASERLVDQPDVCSSKTFKKAPRNFDNEAGAVVVKNMPRVRSQDSFGTCFAYAGTLLAQHNYCRNRLLALTGLTGDIAQKYKTDLEEFKTCQNLSPKNEISPLHASTARYENDKKEKVIKFNFTRGGNTAQSLKLLGGRYGTEKCYPSDILINQYGMLKTKNFMTIEQEKYAAAHAKVLRAQFTEAEILEDCKECLSNAKNTQIRKEGVEALQQLKNFIFDKTKKNESEITDRKNLSDNKEINKITNDEQNEKLATALSKETTQTKKDRTFEEFMADVTFSSMNAGCNRINYSEDIEYYPKTSEISNLIQTEKKLIDILKSDRPVAINGVCVNGDDIEGCKALHEIVSSGYYQDVSTGTKYIKVQNSYGTEWQDFCTKGGWVMMDSILGRTRAMGSKNDDPRTILDQNVLTWLGK